MSKKKPISPSLLSNYPILVKALETIIKEAVFDKRILYHYTYYDYEEAVKSFGEVYFYIYYRFSSFSKDKKPLYICVVTYTAVGFLAYHSYLLIQRNNQHPHYAVEIEAERFVEIQTNTYLEVYLERSLQNEGFTLTNNFLIKHARSQLKNYFTDNMCDIQLPPPSVELCRLNEPTYLIENQSKEIEIPLLSADALKRMNYR